MQQIEKILGMPKFLALFRGSLETEKYSFMREMWDIVNDEEVFEAEGR